MATINEIAKKSGFSKATVSYALNGNEKISKATRNAILKIAEELNYRPSTAAKRLKGKGKKRIGMFINSFKTETYNNLMMKLELKFRRLDYSLVIFSSEALNHILEDDFLAGAIFFSPNTETKDIENASRFLPVIVLDREIDDSKVISIAVDNEKAMENMIETLLLKGYKKIAYLSGHKNNMEATQRKNGYINALKRNSIEINNDYIFIGEFHQIDGYDLIKKLYAENRIDFDALVCANDDMAIGAIMACNELGVKIPNDIAISGFDDTEFCSIIDPQLTSVRIDLDDWSNQIVNTIVAQIEEREISISKPKYSVIERKSTK